MLVIYCQMCHLCISSLLSRIFYIRLDHRLPTAATWVHSQVRSCEVCSGHNDVGACFLRVRLCPLPIFRTPTTLHVDSTIKIEIYIITVDVTSSYWGSGWPLSMVSGLVGRWPGTDSRQRQSSEAQPIILISNTYRQLSCKVQQLEREANRSPPIYCRY
jgi:hypothetical protein